MSRAPKGANAQAAELTGRLCTVQGAWTAALPGQQRVQQFWLLCSGWQATWPWMQPCSSAWRWSRSWQAACWQPSAWQGRTWLGQRSCS